MDEVSFLSEAARGAAGETGSAQRELCESDRAERRQCTGNPREAHFSHAPAVDMTMDEQDHAYEKTDQNAGQQEQKHRAHLEIEAGDQQKESVTEAQGFS